MTLSVNAEDTAPVPAKMSAMDVMSGHSSFTTPVINGNNLYLLPKYLLLLINDVLYSFVLTATAISLTQTYYH